MTVRLLIADDHKIVRDGLKALLESRSDMKVVAEAENGRQAVELIQQVPVDVVIMDVAMPVLNGVEATRRILAHNRNVKVIALSMHSDRRFVTEILKAGASGYLLKDCAFEELAQAIEAVLSGATYLSPRVADLLVQHYVRGESDSHPSSAFSLLTPREREVLQLLAEGKSTKEIALHLKVSPKTVETHRRQIMTKLGVNSVAELTKYAIREGLTHL